MTKKIAIKFRGDVTGIITEDTALKITELFAQYQETRKDVILNLPGGKSVRISNLETMEDIKEREPETLPIEYAMLESIEEEMDPEAKTLKETQLRVFAHNKKCIAAGRMSDYIWYYLKDGKMIRTTREVMEKRAKEKIRADLLSRPGVSGVNERDGQLSIIIPGATGMMPERMKR